MRSNLTVIGAIALGMATSAPAATISPDDPLVPAGLGVGDTFHLIFVTSTTRDGNSGEIADYNTFVNTAANSGGSQLAALGATWYAVASTQGSPKGTSRSAPGYIPPVAAIENAVVTAAVYLPDGTKIADDSADMWDGDIDAPINIDELGNVVATDTQVWTGSRATYAGQWGYPAAWPYGADGNTETAGYYWNSLGDRAPGYYRYGRVGQTGSKWIAGPERIGGSLSFYALSEELTIGSALSIKLAVTYVPASDNLVFTWNSQSGMLYDLLSATDLTTAPDTPWAVYDDGVTVTTDLEADPSGTNTLTVPRPTADATRFFAILEKDSPPLLSEDFEANDGGFTASKTTGTDWAHGAPTSGSAGSPNAGGFVDSGAGSPPSAQCWGTDIGNPGFYADPTTDSCLSSPVIDLSVIAGAELRFAQALDFPAGDTAVVRVIDVSTSTEIVSGPFPLTVTDSAPTSALWENAGPYALPVGGQIRIEWCFSGTGDTSDDYMGWYIDDVRVTAD